MTVTSDLDGSDTAVSVPILMYSTPWCPYCVRARRLLQKKGVAFDVIDVAAEPSRRQEMIDKAGRRTVPQIWIGERHVGGCDELFALERQGRLDALLNGCE